jgi:hypothetical protein
MSKLRKIKIALSTFILLCMIICLAFYSQRHYSIDFQMGVYTERNPDLGNILSSASIMRSGYSVQFENVDLLKLKPRGQITYTFKDNVANLGYFLDVLSVDYNLRIRVNNFKRIVIVEGRNL